MFQMHRASRKNASCDYCYHNINVLKQDGGGWEVANRLNALICNLKENIVLDTNVKTLTAKIHLKAWYSE